MNFERFVKPVAMAVGVLLLTACAQKGPAPMYLWESFARQQYDTLLREASSNDMQILAAEAHIEKAKATGTSVPPGLRAHLGMLKLATGNQDEARRQWESEKAAFPESAPYMDVLLKRLSLPSAVPNAPAKSSPASSPAASAAKLENPA